MKKKNMSLIFIGLLSSYSLFTFDLYQPALPAITRYFDSTQAVGQLTLSIYLLVFGLAQMIWGPLIDHFGRRRLLPVSLLVAVGAAFICLFAKSMEVLILGRALQGLAICCSNMIAVSSSRDFDDDKERAKVVSYISMVVSASPIFAPVVGSLVFVYFGWQANFLVMVLFGLLLLWLGLVSLKESPYWIKTNKPFSTRQSLSQYRAILNHRYLWLGIAIIALSFSTVMITVVNAAYLIIDSLGFTPLQFAFIFALNGVNIIVGNVLGIRLREHFSLHWNIFAGSFLMIIGSLLMLGYYLINGFHLMMLLPALIVNLGVSVTLPPTMSLVLTSYTKLTASAVAMINTTRMMVSATVAGLIGLSLGLNMIMMPLSILLCGVLCLAFSYLFVTSPVIHEEV